MFGLVFAGIGLTAFIVFASAGLESGERGAWPKADGVVTAGDIIYPKGSEEYRYDLTFEFIYQGNKYQSHNVTYKSSSGDYDEVKLWSTKYPTGKRIKCFVDEKDPEKSFLEAKESSSLPLIASLIPLIFVCVGIGIVINVWRDKGAISEGKSKSDSSEGLAGKIGISLFFSIFAIVGTCVFYFLTLSPLLEVNSADNWQKTDAKVISSRVESRASDDGTTYRVDIVFEYTHNNRKYSSNKYNFETGSSSGRAAKQKIVRKYKKGKNTTCFVNPENPSEAVIVREAGSTWWVGILFGGIFGGVGYSGLIWALFFSDSAGNTPKSSGSKRKHKQKPHGTIDLDGEVILKPKSSKTGKIIGSILIAAFWNGIVSVFVNEAYFQSEGEWFLKLFLLPFMIIGICFIGNIFYQILAATNSKVNIIANSNVLRLGDCLNLRWTMPGNVSKIDSLKISFVGTEEATYRRGTDTHTDRNDFFTDELINTRDKSEMIDSGIDIDIPESFMHSFESRNNKILWIVRVHGDIKFWPDIKEEYAITILPQTIGNGGKL